MSDYCTLQDVKDFSTMPAEDVDAVELQYPGLTAKLIKVVSGMFDARLTKRYAAPFGTPYPDALIVNVAREVGWRLWMKRGFNPAGLTDQALEKDHLEVLDWLREAADSEKGLVELPVRQATPLGAAAVDAGTPIGYGEASPYTWTQVQRDLADLE